MKKIKIGIFGGTFNPPHIGHINIAISAYEQINLNKIIFIPTSKPLYKAIPKNSANFNQRICMIKLAIENLFFAEINNMEIYNKKINYTFNTIKELRKNIYMNKNIKFYFIVGTDMFLDIHKWYRFSDLIKLISFIVFPRSKEDLLILKKKLKITLK